MPRLVHISDLHFGKTFDFAVWNKVKGEILAARPATIIVSGDFIDSPDPLLLLAAKFELEDLCRNCGPETQLFVVPGNHDVLDFGNIWHPGAAWWFERVMFNDTAKLRKNLEAGLHFSLGLNEETLRWAKLPKISRVKPDNWIWKQKCDGRLQSCDYHRSRRHWPSQSVHDQTLITCFNSNSSALRSIVFATGEVGGDQITRIGMRSADPACPYCGPRRVAEGSPDPEHTIHLRVAVLHHHALPIAIPSKSRIKQGSESRLEPFLILKNGGDLIHELQRHRFDLVLHGHKHRPQFARIELQADNREGYPLLVLAGGSTAKKDEDAPDNTLRIIRTEPNGRLNVRTFEQAILADGRMYQEPLTVFKRRAFVNAIERAQISADELYSEVVIESVGHLRSIDRTSGLRVRSKGVIINGMAINVMLASHDERQHFDVEEACRDRVTLQWRDAKGAPHNLRAPHLPKDGYCWLALREPLEIDSPPVTYGVREAAANSIAMTRWELIERNRNNDPDFDEACDYEEVGFYIGYPVERFLLRLQLPSGMDGITPEVRYHRHPDYPNFPLTFLPEQRNFRTDPRRFPRDAEVEKEESKRLRYDAGQRSWFLEIERPIAGGIYSLRWLVPNPIASATAVDRTHAFQNQLLKLVTAPEASRWHGEQCRRLFADLALLLMKRFRSPINPDEVQTAFLMVYDETKLCLRPVLTHLSSGPLPQGSYEVPLGGGVAGAAFLQRRIVAWKNDPASRSLIKPPSDSLHSRWVLALPIYYQAINKDGKLELETQPGALIGVVTLGSNEISSQISECYKEDATAKEIGQEAQELAQKYVFGILENLSQKHT
jgi:predicted MPP superfamily phosphohydrolase